ncbi:nitrite and sulphite reductase 4Fe-4S region [Thermodesulfobium narugense DSM 14796]|uniref:Nitrite and sulphite reductase 4Fe-4S region n=1 Tax=Thermodesulfobium narugense DSM 14796 TaxID=747365 RepID=M1E8H1_9BACT|nr:nitrate/sulfite reductase [Thermodesulfobium narugense]AEE14940.1 nitrite and sulphite reductase 4Fe-4S region [Thermodesulfobium narugense DSM 14796]
MNPEILKKLPMSFYVPDGVLNPLQLKLLLELSNNGFEVILSGNSSITIPNLDPLTKEKLKESGFLQMPHMENKVFYAQTCLSKPYCPMSRQDARTLSRRINENFYGMITPAKVKISISGCPNGCSEPLVRDIGIMGYPTGYAITIGGFAGRNGGIGEVIFLNLDESQTVAKLAKLLEIYKNYAQEKERMYKFLRRVSLEFIKEKMESKE